MAVEVVMPALGRSQGTVRLVRWLKREGERVAAGEPLMTVEAERAVFEVDSPGTGLLSGVRVREGEAVRAGTVLAYLLAPAARPPEMPAEAPPTEAVRPAVSPPLAAGPPLSGVWRAMAEGAVRSWREVPHLFLQREVDASQLVIARGRQPEGVTYTDLLLRLAAVTLARHPVMNAGRRDVNLAVAVWLEAGVVAPVIHGADRLDVPSLAARRAELADRARSGRMLAEDLSGATFTVGNLGMYGVDVFQAIVTDGQAGILAVGRIADRVVPVGGRPRVRPALTLGLSCDQRVVDGARAARFLSDLASALEEPSPYV